MIDEEDLNKFEKLADDFAAKELAGKTWGGEVIGKAFRSGFLSVMPSPEPGGPEEGLGALCVILRALCRVDASLGGIIFTTTLARNILQEAKADRMLKEAGEGLVAFPSYSDPSMLELPEAVQTGGTWAITGGISLLVLGNLAPRAIVPARRKGQSGWSFFMIDPAGPGVTRSHPVLTLGLQACPAVDVTMTAAGAALVGAEGEGERCFGRIAGSMNAAAGAMNAGIMEGSLGEAVAYARERFQGGRPIIDWSQVGMILADMTMKTRAAGLCLEQAWRKPDQAAAGALHIHELACDVVTNGVQVLGGYGYMKDYGQERRYRDARQVQALLGSHPARKLSLIREGCR